MVLISEKQLQDLKQDLKQSNQAAFALGTRRNLRIQWESYLLFCFYFKFVSLPTSTQTLQLYAQFLSRTFKSTESIRNYLNGIKTMHLLLGYSVEHINSFIINLCLKGIARLNPHCVKQAEEMTPEILLRVSEVLDFTSKDDRVYWCLFLFAFFLLARKSNLVPSSSKDLSSGQFLLRKNVQDLGICLMVTFTWTKTIQKGERTLKLPLVPINRSVLCPVKAYKNMCKAIPASPKSALFLLSNGKVVTYYQFQKKLRQCLDMIGLNSMQFSSHSFRRGAASLAFRAKIPADKIKMLGDWKSDCYRRYLCFSFNDKITVSEEMNQYILNHF